MADPSPSGDKGSGGGGGNAILMLDEAASDVAGVETETVVIGRTEAETVDEEAYATPVALLRAGELVAIPTETVYGLGANALDGDACRKIYAAKGRPADNPLIVHIARRAQLEEAGLVDSAGLAAMYADHNLGAVLDAFWPGPLTILFPRGEAVPEVVTAGQPTVAIRMPAHPVAHRLLDLANVPVAAPSANLSGRPSPTTAEHVSVDLGGRIPCIVDSGPCDVGVESTVIDLAHDPPLVLRPGGVTLEDLAAVVPGIALFSKVVNDAEQEEMKAAPPTPGLKYRHYSPTAEVVLVEGETAAEIEATLRAFVAEARGRGRRVGVIHTRTGIEVDGGGGDDDDTGGAPVVEVRVGDNDHPEEVARGIFGALRELDGAGVDVIVLAAIDEAREGLAVMNRVRKAASQTIR